MKLTDAAVSRLRDVADRPDLGGTRYALVREIGRGGMGVVYEADDMTLQRRVAVKVLSPEWSSPEMAERLRREARTIARLEHPGIVPVHDVGAAADGRVFYAMKLIRGVSLAEYCRTPRPRTDLFRIFVRICEAVAFAHANGVVHRDIKRENVMVGEFGEVLVMDWGVAHVPGDSDAHGVVVGTREFMAPEQSRGETVDHRADIFSLGILLRVITSGERVPRPLASIVAKASAADIANRYDDARELASDLIRFTEGEPVSAHREHIGEKAGRWISRNRALVAMIVAYLIMRAIVLFWARL